MSNRQAIKIAHALALTAQAIAREASKHYLAGGLNYEADAYAEFAGALGAAPGMAWEKDCWQAMYDGRPPARTTDPLAPVARRAAASAFSRIRAALPIPGSPSAAARRAGRSPRRAKQAGGKTSSNIGLRYQR